MPIGVIYATAAGRARPHRRVEPALTTTSSSLRIAYGEIRRAAPRSAAERTQGAKAETGAGRRFMSFGSFQADLDGRLVNGANGAVIDMAKSEFDVLKFF